MIYISNNDDEINVICDFGQLGMNPNELAGNRIESIIEFIRANSQFWNRSNNRETVSRRKEIINGFESILVGEEEEKMDYECSICLEKYKLGDVVKQLNCNHMFHESCILRWAETSGNCPFCRCCFASAEVETNNDQNHIDSENISRIELLRNFVTGNEHHEQGQNNYDNCEMTDYADDENYENNENYESFENQEH